MNTVTTATTATIPAALSTEMTDQAHAAGFVRRIHGNTWLITSAGRVIGLHFMPDEIPGVPFGLYFGAPWPVTGDSDLNYEQMLFVHDYFGGAYAFSHV